MQPRPPPRRSDTGGRLGLLLLSMAFVVLGSCVAYVSLEQERGPVGAVLGLVLMVGGVILMVWTRRR